MSPSRKETESLKPVRIQTISRLCRSVGLSDPLTFAAGSSAGLHPPIKQTDRPRNQRAHQQRGGRAGGRYGEPRTAQRGLRRDHPSPKKRGVCQHRDERASVSTARQSENRPRDRRPPGEPSCAARASTGGGVAWRARGRPAPALFLPPARGCRGAGCPGRGHGSFCVAWCRDPDVAAPAASNLQSTATVNEMSPWP